MYGVEKSHSFQDKAPPSEKTMQLQGPAYNVEHAHKYKFETDSNASDLQAKVLSGPAYDVAHDHKFQASSRKL